MRGGLREDSGHHATIARPARDSSALMAGRGSCRRSRAGRFRRAQISLGLILGEIENDNLVGRARTFNVKLDWLADGFVFFLDALVIRDYVQGVAVVFCVHFLELHLNGADMLRASV